jgi:hypothetical protein
VDNAEFDRDYRWPLLRMLSRRRKPVYAPSAEQIRAALRRAPHPFALDGTRLSCACGLGVLSDIHDEDSLIDTRAVLDGTGGARERMVREMAGRMPEDDVDFSPP